MKPQTPKPTAGPDAGPWIDLGNGRFRSASTGRMKYDPQLDPAWREALRRLVDQAAKAGKCEETAD